MSVAPIIRAAVDEMLGVEWAVYSHPIIRFDTDPVPVLGKGTRAEMEDLYFRTIEDPDVDEFYIELAPSGSFPE
jgi:hypothetical protein